MNVLETRKSPSRDGIGPILRISIIGAGLAGLSTAIALAKLGHEVTIFERKPVLHEIGAGINLPPNATSLFRTWGLLPQIEAVSFEPAATFIRSWSTGHKLAIQSFADLRDEYSAPYLVVHRADLHKVLLQHAKDTGVSIRLNCDIKPADINLSAPSIHLSDHELFDADVIFGADGERSVCRNALLGYSEPPLGTGDLVWRFTAKASTVREHGLLDLVDPPNINYWMGPESHALSYVVKRDDLLNVVLTTPSKSGVTLYGIQKADPDELRAAFDKWDPERLGKLLHLAEASSKWSLLQSNELDNWRHPGGKFALIGDSAHAMLPYLGQGAAQSFEDASVLGTLFSKISHKAQIPALLGIYEKVRRPRSCIIRQRSTDFRSVWGTPDGSLQEERDRLLAFLPFEGCPYFLADPVFQKWLWGYDTAGAAAKAWEEWNENDE